MSTIRIAMVLGVFSVLAVSLSMGHALVYAQSASISIVPNAATLGDKSYSPNPGEVKVGEPVTWTNDDTQIHTAVSGISPLNDTADSGPDGVFDSGIMQPKDTFEFTFDQAGEYDYYCTLHPQMVAKIVVS
jgi:plastocyanin